MRLVPNLQPGNQRSRRAGDLPWQAARVRQGTRWCRIALHLRSSGRGLTFGNYAYDINMLPVVSAPRLRPVLKKRRKPLHFQFPRNFCLSCCCFKCFVSALRQERFFLSRFFTISEGLPGTRGARSCSPGGPVKIFIIMLSICYKVADINFRRSLEMVWSLLDNKVW